MLNGARNPPQIFGGSNFVLNFVAYLWDTTLVYCVIIIFKMALRENNTCKPARARGNFFADKMPNHWRVSFENGNSLSIYSLPPKIFYITQKDSVAFA